MNTNLSLSAEALEHVKNVTEAPDENDNLALRRVDQFQFDDCTVVVGDAIIDKEKSGTVVALVAFPLYSSSPQEHPFVKLAILGNGEDWIDCVVLGKASSDGELRAKEWRKVDAAG